MQYIKRLTAVVVLLTIVSVGLAKSLSSAKIKAPAKVSQTSDKPRHSDPKIASAILAVEDLIKTFGDKYPKGQHYLAELKKGNRAIIREALLANPLLDNEKLLVIRRRKNDPGVVAPIYTVGDLNRKIASELAVMSNLRTKPTFKTIYKPRTRRTITDVDLHFDAKRALFTMPDDRGKYGIFEVNIDGTGFKQLTPKDTPEVNSFDGCYTPADDIIYTSDASYQGLPCEAGRRLVSSTYKLNTKTGRIRQLTFDQDSNWNPTILPDGRVLYLRWEYTDTAHFFTRILMTMNPDGTNQKEYYGSNSFWPNSMFGAKPIPGKSGQFIATVTGHHTVKQGSLFLFDVNKGRREDSGVIQELPGRGKKVKPVIADRLYAGKWPKFLNPQPLGTSPADGAGRYFIVSGQLRKRARWGIYLIDVFDNITPIYEGPAFEPIVLKPRPLPRKIPSRVNLNSKEATVYINDIYFGPGLAGVPRGTVKELRVVTYDYSYPRSGSFQAVGMESGWDIKRVLGNVPVGKDGYAVFKVPANMPIMIQPLDAQGRAIQLMRSWFVGMPGEVVSCSGCHESQNSNSPVSMTARLAKPTPIKTMPWSHEDGFSFERDIQKQVLNRYCIGCHSSKNAKKRNIPDFEDNTLELYPELKQNTIKYPRKFYNFHPWVRRPGPESDYHMFRPMEYHASTSELVQMLKRGHHGVKLSDDAWRRLYTWIDLNVPYAGSWSEAHKTAFSPWAGSKNNKHQRREMARSMKIRRKYRKLYAGIDPKWPQKRPELPPVKFQPPVKPKLKPVKVPAVKGWPFDAATAAKLQNVADKKMVVDLGAGQEITLVRIPAGTFVMGDPTVKTDERNVAKVTIEKPFWMSTTEITNSAYRRFNPKHDSRYFDEQTHNHETAGIPANRANQPVIRVSWDEAMEFCKWLSKRTGKNVTLPTEAQWEWAARAGSNTPMWYGKVSDNFTAYENLADSQLAKFGTTHGHPHRPMKKPSDKVAFIPRVKSVNDGSQVTSLVGSYKPNAFGLYDMLGNVSEWTRSEDKPYPYRKADGRNRIDQGNAMRIVRGGSWRARPKVATAALRRRYRNWQKVYNVGFRIVIPIEQAPAKK